MRIKEVKGNSKGLLTCLTVITLLVAGPVHASNHVFYVSPDGNDNFSGMAAERTASDGPFCSLERARDAIRNLKSAGEFNSPVIVYVRGGTYYLNNPLVLTPEDSGTEKLGITYQAYKNEKPVISGGRAINGFKQNGRLWIAQVPEVKAGKWYFYQLFVNGSRRTNARNPNIGYLRTKYTLDKGFDFRPGDIRKWEESDNARITLFHLWESSTHYISAVDANSGYVELDTGIPWAGMPWIEKEQRYIVENVFEALDEPGEWYLSAKTGQLYYYPIAGEDINEASVIAPVLEVTLVEFAGDTEKGRFVEHISFKGISFNHAEARLERGKIPQVLQAAFKQNAAIMAKGLRHTSFEKCRIENVGEHGIWLGSGCQHNRIAQCLIGDIGAGGVRIGEDWAGSTDANSTSHNIVDNSVIYNGGLFFHGAVGIWVGKSSYNEITHNEVFDFDQTGISIGWEWGYAPSSANHNKIEYNHVHHIGHGVLSDMGAIYLLGISPGTTVRNNLIHDVVGYPSYWNGFLADGEGDMPSSGNGIYPDEGCSHVLFENNIVYNVKGTCFSVNYCRDNIVRNNIFAMGKRAMALFLSDKNYNMLDISNNIMICTGPTMLLGQWAEDTKVRSNKNLFWSTQEPKSTLFSRKSFAEWRKLGHDKDSLFANPEFKNAAAGDFSLEKDSPAWKIGFKQIEKDKSGLYGDQNWVAMGKIRPRADAPEPPIRQPEIIDENFERSMNLLQAFTFCMDPRVGGESKSSITVSKEQHVSGQYSVKVTDAANSGKTFSGKINNFFPYFYYEPNFRKGVALFTCNIMNSQEKPSEIAIQMRDWNENIDFFQTEDHPRIGPAITIMPDGTVFGGGSKLTTVPNGQWVKICFEVDMDSDQKDFVLKITGAEGKQQQFRVPFASKKFSMISWVGLSSKGNTDSVFYVDDIMLRSK